MELVNHSLWLMLSYQSVGFFVLALFLSRFNKSKVQLVFALFILSLGINTFLIHILLFNHNQLLIWLYPLVFSLGLTLTPLFYLHQKGLLDAKYQVRYLDIFHLIPAIIMFIMLTPFWFLVSNNESFLLDSVYGVLLVKTSPTKQTILIECIIKGIFIGQVFFYAWKIYNLYKEFQHVFLNKLCKNASIFLSGIKLFTISFLLMMLLLVFHQSFHTDNNSIASAFYVVALLIINIGLVYYGLIFSDKFICIFQLEKIPLTELDIPTDQEHAIKITSPLKYKNSCLCDEFKTDILKRLQLIMIEKEPYLDPKLKIEDLANMLNTNSKYLSQIINDSFGKNFYHYLNGFRCDKVIQLFKDRNYNDYGIDGIANSCGFNSRSSFVAAFKNHTGQVPSVYRNSVKVMKKEK